MGEKTAIAWTDATWNPWRGCRKVSSGCRNCYMFRDEKWRGRDPNIVVRSKSTFADPLKWTEPRKVFTCSLSDFFIEEADAWRGKAWSIVSSTPHHTYQILTKRPENVPSRLPHGWPLGYGNVWLGVSAEDQRAADERIPLLLQIPAAVRFVSCEPLLEAIDLRLFERTNHYYCDEGTDDDPDFVHRCKAPIDWVITGGESGPGFREMNLDWARSLRDQCVAANIPFFYKQNSALRPGANPLLDGVEWHQFPAPSGAGGA